MKTISSRLESDAVSKSDARRESRDDLISVVPAAPEW